MLRRELPNGYALRLLEESDADELIALIDANRAHLERWMPWVEHEHEPADVLPFIRATRRQIADNDGLQTAIVAPGRADRGDGRLPQHRLDEPQVEHRLLAGARRAGPRHDDRGRPRATSTTRSRRGGSIAS